MNWFKKLFKKAPVDELPPPVPTEEKAPEKLTVTFVGQDGKKLEGESKELTEAIAELQKLLNTPDGFASLEAFMDASSEGREVPFQIANGLPDGFHQVLEETENHKFDTEHWSDSDFLEHVMSYYHQGYEFEGLEQLFNKYQETKELTETDRETVRRWYFLAAQEMVYDV